MHDLYIAEINRPHTVSSTSQ